MNKNNLIGSYTLLKPLCKLTNNCLIYEALNNVDKQPYTAEIHALNKQIDLSTLLLSMRRGQTNKKIDQLIYLCNNERIYLVVIRNTKLSSINNIDLKSINISASNCKQIMMEALQFISGLHRMGILLSCELSHFLQIHLNVIYGISLPTICPPVILNNHASSISAAVPLDFNLRKQQIKFIKDFYEQLQKMVKLPNNISFELPANQKVVDCFNSAINQNKKINTSVLLQILSEYAIIKDGFSLYIKLEKVNGIYSLYVEYEDKGEEQMKRFTVSNSVKIRKSRTVIQIRELFYILSSRFPEEIKIYSNCVLYFWDLVTCQWKLIQLKSTAEDVDEEQNISDQVKNMESQWNQINENSINNNNQKQQNARSKRKRRKKNIKHPFDKIVQIIATIRIRETTFDIKGVGTLVDQQFVLTCAHILFPKSLFQNRIQAWSVIIKIANEGEQIIRRGQWMFPEQFRKTQNRAFDFAIIKLNTKTQGARLNQKNIQFAIGYREVDRRVVLAKTQAPSNINQTQIDSSMGNEGTFQYIIWTMKGDSGSPLIIQPRTINSSCYIVGLHSSGKYRSRVPTHKQKTAVKITQMMLEQLSRFQVQLAYGDKISQKEKEAAANLCGIRNCVVYFDQLKCDTSESHKLLESIKYKVDNNFQQLTQLSIQRLLTMSKQLKSLKISSQEFLNLNEQMQILKYSIFAADIERLKTIQKLQLLTQYRKQYQKYCLYQEENMFFYGLKILAIFPVTQKIANPNKTKTQTRLKLMQGIEQNYGQQLKWEVYVWQVIQRQCPFKLVAVSQHFLPLVQSMLISQKLFELIGLEMKINVNNYLAILNQWIVKWQKIKVLDIFPSNKIQVIFPLCSLKQIKNQANEWQFRVQYQSRVIRNQTFWWIHNIKNERFAHLILYRNYPNSHNRKHIYQLRLKLTKRYTISDCLEACFDVVQWLAIFYQMVHFAIAIHNQGKSISFLIEDCVRIDQDKITPIFFYCQPFYALKHQYSLLSLQQQRDLSQYLPKKQLEQSNSSPEKVDVWIMGKAFERIINMWKCQRQIEGKIQTVLRTVISRMITTPEERFIMHEVQLFLLEYLKTGVQQVIKKQHKLP